LALYLTFSIFRILSASNHFVFNTAILFSSLLCLTFNGDSNLAVRKRKRSFRAGPCIPQKWGGAAMLQTPDPWKKDRSDKFNYLMCIRA